MLIYGLLNGRQRALSPEARRLASFRPVRFRTERYIGAGDAVHHPRYLLCLIRKTPSKKKCSRVGEPPASRKLNWQSAGRALRHRNFQLFFSGQLISLIGTWMQTVAQSWLVYRMTGSGLLLGAVGFASQIPVFLVAPLGGITADRGNRQRIVIATQVASMLLAFVLAALTLTHTVKVWHIFVLAALLGVVNAFDIPGRQAFLVDMVGKDDLMNAIALNSSMFNGARVIGPAVAGVLVARLGEGWCFFANAVSYIAVIVGLMMMRVHAPAKASLQYLADGSHHRRISVCEPNCADSCAARLAGPGQRDRNALRRPDADFCGQDSPQWRPGIRVHDRIARSGCGSSGHLDGRGGRRSSAGSAHFGGAFRSQGTGHMDFGVLRRLRNQPDPVRVLERRSGCPWCCCCRWDISSCCRWRPRTR